VIEFIQNHYQEALAAIGFFALVSTLTPNTTDNKIVDVMLKAINIFGANFGKAKNDVQTLGGGDKQPPPGG